MPSGLETIAGENGPNRYRSEGERRIAATLEKYAVPFHYEQPVRMTVSGKTKTFRPDFYLPQFDLYIEYFGRVGNQNYDSRTAEKHAAYAASHLNYIALYPWDLVQDWPNYLLDRLRTPSIPATASCAPQQYKSTIRPATPIRYHRPKHSYRHTGARPYR